jgi:hydrogenase maturation protease
MIAVAHPNRVLVVGIGNLYRGDDAAGPEIVRQLQASSPDGAATVMVSDDIGGLIDQWEGYELVILVDATQSGAPPGTVIRLDAKSQQIPHIFPPALSSHGFGIGEVLELAEALDALPERLLVYGVEGQSFEIGASLSPAVAAAIPAVVERILVNVQRILQSATMPA